LFFSSTLISFPVGYALQKALDRILQRITVISGLRSSLGSNFLLLWRMQYGANL